MPNVQTKPRAKSWKDIQMVLSALAVTLTLGLWNLIALPKKPTIGGQAGEANLDPQTNPAVAVTPALPLLPGQVLLLNGAVSQTPLQSSQVSPTVNKPRHGGGGKGGTVTSTSSSHP